MNLSVKSFQKTPYRFKIKKIYLEAFPKYEQLPWWLLRFLTTRKGIDMTAYYDGEDLCGFTYTVTTDTILFVLFFAVKKELRGKGYGSAILRYLKESNPQKSILLNIELLDPNAENYDERVRRFRFYENNGFIDTKYDIEEIGGIFRVLATTPIFDIEEYIRVFQKMSFGLWKPRIMKGE